MKVYNLENLNYIEVCMCDNFKKHPDSADLGHQGQDCHFLLLIICILKRKCLPDYFILIFLSSSNRKIFSSVTS